MLLWFTASPSFDWMRAFPTPPLPASLAITGPASTGFRRLPPRCSRASPGGSGDSVRPRASPSGTAFGTATRVFFCLWWRAWFSLHTRPQRFLPVLLCALLFFGAPHSGRPFRCGTSRRQWSVVSGGPALLFCLLMVSSPLSFGLGCSPLRYWRCGLPPFKTCACTDFRPLSPLYTLVFISRQTPPRAQQSNLVFSSPSIFTVLFLWCASRCRSPLGVPHIAPKSILKRFVWSPSFTMWTHRRSASPIPSSRTLGARGEFASFFPHGQIDQSNMKEPISCPFQRFVAAGSLPLLRAPPSCMNLTEVSPEGPLRELASRSHLVPRSLFFFLYGWNFASPPTDVGGRVSILATVLDGGFIVGPLFGNLPVKRGPHSLCRPPRVPRFVDPAWTSFKGGFAPC